MTPGTQAAGKIEAGDFIVMVNGQSVLKESIPLFKELIRDVETLKFSVMPNRPPDKADEETVRAASKSPNRPATGTKSAKSGRGIALSSSNTSGNKNNASRSDTCGTTDTSKYSRTPSSRTPPRSVDRSGPNTASPVRPDDPNVNMLDTESTLESRNGAMVPDVAERPLVL